MTERGPIVLDEGSIQDLDAVMDVMDDSFDPVFGEAWTSPQCAGLLPMPGVWLTLARLDDLVVGFALSRVVLREAELLLLAVRGEWQGSGIGRLLLDDFARAASRRGADRLHLEVRDGNEAIRLYRQSGFTEIGRRRNYYSGRDGQVYDALTLAKQIEA
jgi:ribosomal-protein-alanine N-acetyltransferase